MMTGLENQQKRKVSQLFTFEVEKQRRENICLHLRIHILKKLESVFREVSTTAKCTKPVVIYPPENKWISGKLGKRESEPKVKKGWKCAMCVWSRAYRSLWLGLFLGQHPEIFRPPDTLPSIIPHSIELRNCIVYLIQSCIDCKSMKTSHHSVIARQEACLETVAKSKNCICSIQLVSSSKRLWEMRCSTLHHQHQEIRVQEAPTEANN